MPFHLGTPKAFCNQIIQGNAAELIAQLPDDSIDMTLTSPPYGEMREYKDFDYQIFSKIELPKIIQGLFRVTKTGGVVVWVTGDQTDETGESGESMRQALAFKEIGFRLHDTMIYMKSGPSYPSNDKYFQIWEYMFIFSKGIPKTFNPIKDRENRWWGTKWSKIRTRRDPNGNLRTQIWYEDEGEKLGKRFNIWQYSVGYGNQGDKISHGHPATFPEALAADQIRSWSNPEDVILDPLAGAGTTLKMAKENNRLFIGFEIASKYIDLAKKRIELANVPLFTLD